MNTSINKIKELLTAGNILASLRKNFLEAIKDSSCDKHNMSFGGDSRFSVFSCKVFLDCHRGYYGNSSCSTMGSVDSVLAERLLNKALNKHMNLILETMATFANQEASELTDAAEKEVAQYQALIDSCKGDSQE